MTRTHVLSKADLRDRFDCGKDSLNLFLKKQSTQYQKKDLCQIFVRTNDDGYVIGYFTLSMSSIDLSVLPEKERKKLPRHPVPVVHLGRLAVCKSAQGKGIGRDLLMEVIERTLRVSAEVSAFALEVYALDEEAISFYESYGFKSLCDDRKHMYISLKTLRKLI